MTLIAQSEPLEIMYLFSLVNSDCSLRSVRYAWLGFCRIMRCLQWERVLLTALLQSFSNSFIISTLEWKILHGFVCFLHKMDLILDLWIQFIQLSFTWLPGSRDFQPWNGQMRHDGSLACQTCTEKELCLFNCLLNQWTRARHIQMKSRGEFNLEKCLLC